MTQSAAVAALMFGASGRLGKVMLQALSESGIESVAVTRGMLASYVATGALPALPKRIVLVDASIDYAHMRRHEADKHVFIRHLAKQRRIELVASFSSGAVDFDDALIASPFYREYKRVKLDNLAFFESLDTRLFYPRIYTLVGPHSFATKSTGWVQVLEQADRADNVAIAHPLEPRSWVAERCVQRLFASFVAGDQARCLEAPVCGTFQLADVVAFCEARRERRVETVPGQATAWLTVPYVAPHPARVDGCTCDFRAELGSLLDASSTH